MDRRARRGGGRRADRHRLRSSGEPGLPMYPGSFVMPGLVPSIYTRMILSNKVDPRDKPEDDAEREAKFADKPDSPSSGELEDDLADMAGAFHQAMGLDNLIERQHRVDHRRDLAGFEQRPDLGAELVADAALL